MIAFSQQGIFNSFKISILRTVIGTVLALAATSSVAYAMTKRHLSGYRFFSFFLTFLVSGGLAPYFLTIRELGLYDTFWMLIIPGMYNFNEAGEAIYGRKSHSKEKEEWIERETGGWDAGGFRRFAAIRCLPVARRRRFG